MKELFRSQAFSKRKRFVLGMVVAMESTNGVWSEVDRTREVSDEFG
jgi:hypothetical protein